MADDALDPAAALPEPPPSLTPLSGTGTIEELVRSHRLLVGSAGAYWERDLIGGEVWYSDNFFAITGMEPTTDRAAVHARIHPGDRPAFERAYQAAIDNLGELIHDLRYRNKDGHYRWARLQGKVWPNEQGQPARIVGMVIDVHAEKSARLGQQEMSERFERAMAATGEAHFEHALADDVFYMSPRIHALLGRPERRDAPDRAEFFSWIHADDQPQVAECARVSMQGPGPWQCDYRLRLADGSYRWFRGRGRTDVSPDGQLRVIGMVGDVHAQMLERHELLEHRQHLQQMVEERTASLEAALAEAQRQRQQAEQANEAKSSFLAHMSHEIRTPLNGLLGLNELALREASTTQQRRFLKLALQSGHGLLEMLNGVLDFSRLSAGVAPPKCEPFDLAETLAACMRQVMPMAREKNLGAMFDYHGHISRLVGDAQRIQQVATNLLTNALKYTATGHVALQTRVASLNDGRWVVEIEVSDTGPGMSPEVAARVFEPFVQGDDSLARAHGGSGLGLSIARGLCESMGGSITLDTRPGAGATFTVSLTLEPEPGISTAAPVLAPGHAWLVYTRQVPAQWLAERMQRLGWSSEVLPSLVDAVQRGGTAPQAPSLVVVAEAACSSAASLAALRQALPDTPITLLVRPDWNQPQLESAARAGNMPLSFMPLTPSALQQLLTIDTAAATPAAESAMGDLDTGIPGGSEVLIAEDNPVNQLIITEMVAALGLRTRLADDGAMALSACLSQAPQLLLMDLQMPNMDGLEATRRLTELQRRGELPAFPIVALTAHATPQDRERCLAAGMKGFLTKPISMGLLRTELRRWMAV